MTETKVKKVKWTEETKNELINNVTEKLNEGKSVTDAFNELTSVYPISSKSIGSQYYVFKKEKEEREKQMAEKERLEKEQKNQKKAEKKLNANPVVIDTEKRKRGRPKKVKTNAMTVITNETTNTNKTINNDVIAINNIRNKDELASAIAKLISYYVDKKETKLRLYEEAIRQFQNIG